MDKKTDMNELTLDQMNKVSGGGMNNICMLECYLCGAKFIDELDYRNHMQSCDGTNRKNTPTPIPIPDPDPDPKPIPATFEQW